MRGYPLRFIITMWGVPPLLKSHSCQALLRDPDIQQLQAERVRGGQCDWMSLGGSLVVSIVTGYPIVS